MTAALTYEELLEENAWVKEENALLKQQLEWFKKQVFGSKSERLVTDSQEPLILFPEMTPLEEGKEEKVAAHTRAKRPSEKTQITLPFEIRDFFLPILTES